MEKSQIRDPPGQTSRIRNTDCQLLYRLSLEVLTVMVVGAGRGPLVRAALTAAKTAQRRVRVFAVEKNPNAVVTLQQQKIELWGDQVSNM